MDYKKLGLKCGLEIHQQLDTGKLFCNCPALLLDAKPDHIFERNLHAVAGETGEIDPSARQAALKGTSYRYHAYDASNCLVELDEEPPHALNEAALNTTRIVSKMLNCSLIDELHIMRKMVIDGSNVSGFQRTALVAVNGALPLEVGGAKIMSVCLEEDSARKLSETDDVVTYNLDRLGVPLIEIATDPSITHPDQARIVAQALGSILRATHKVKRGIGTIRQDVNISIRDGARVEVKGVQDLSILAKVVENEAARQVAFLDLKAELKKRGAKKAKKPVDVTDVFKKSSSKVIQGALKNGGVVFALALPGFAGLLGHEVNPGRRVGTELSDYAKAYGSKGLFHSDELPNYGISDADVSALRKKLKLTAKDAFILIAEQKATCEKCMRAVVDRVNASFTHVLEETRRANPDGTSSYLRPLPGGARMYPETDLRPIQLGKAELQALEKNLPELPWDAIEVLKKKYGLSQELAGELYGSMYLNLFLELVQKQKADPKVIAVTFTNHLKSLDDPQILQEQHFKDLFSALSAEKFSKEAIPQLLQAWEKAPGSNLKELLKDSGTKSFSDKDLEALVARVVKKNEALIKSKGPNALSALMGDVMKEARGNADGKRVMELLRKSLN